MKDFHDVKKSISRTIFSIFKSWGLEILFFQGSVLILNLGGPGASWHQVLILNDSKIHLILKIWTYTSYLTYWNIYIGVDTQLDHLIQHYVTLKPVFFTVLHVSYQWYDVKVTLITVKSFPMKVDFECTEIIFNYFTFGRTHLMIYHLSTPYSCYIFWYYQQLIDFVQKIH